MVHSYMGVSTEHESKDTAVSDRPLVGFPQFGQRLLMTTQAPGIYVFCFICWVLRVKNLVSLSTNLNTATS